MDADDLSYDYDDVEGAEQERSPIHRTNKQPIASEHYGKAKMRLLKKKSRRKDSSLSSNTKLENVGKESKKEIKSSVDRGVKPKRAPKQSDDSGQDANFDQSVDATSPAQSPKQSVGDAERKRASKKSDYSDEDANSDQSDYSDEDANSDQSGDDAEGRRASKRSRLFSKDVKTKNVRQSTSSSEEETVQVVKVQEAPDSEMKTKKARTDSQTVTVDSNSSTTGSPDDDEYVDENDDSEVEKSSVISECGDPDTTKKTTGPPDNRDFKITDNIEITNVKCGVYTKNGTGECQSKVPSTRGFGRCGHHSKFRVKDNASVVKISPEELRIVEMVRYRKWIPRTLKYLNAMNRDYLKRRASMKAKRAAEMNVFVQQSPITTRSGTKVGKVADTDVANNKDAIDSATTEAEMTQTIIEAQEKTLALYKKELDDMKKKLEKTKAETKSIAKSAKRPSSQKATPSKKSRK